MIRLTRRRFFKSIATSLPCGIGYAALIEPGWPEVREWAVRLREVPLPRPVTVLHLSDLHCSTAVPLRLIDRAISLGLARKPDVCCITGDFITDRITDAPAFMRVLARLPDSVPTYAVMGNHDGGAWASRHDGYPTSGEVRELLSLAGVRVLHNASVALRCDTTRMRLTGLGDIWADECVPSRAFPELSMDDAHVVLSHNPDSKERLAGYPWDLLLCGHTHGGQVAIPGVGGRHFAPVRDDRFIDGLYRWQGRHLHVSRGIGSILGIRFNCRPDVSVLHLN